MIRFASIAIALLAASPACAGSIVLTIENHGSQTVSGIDAFPISAENGAIVEDNLSGYVPAVAAGASSSLTLDGDTCGPTYFRIGLLDETQQTINVDTCTEQTLVISD